LFFKVFFYKFIKIIFYLFIYYINTSKQYKNNRNNLELKQFFFSSKTRSNRNSRQPPNLSKTGYFDGSMCCQILFQAKTKIIKSCRWHLQIDALYIYIYIGDIFSSAHFFWRKNLLKVQQSLGPDISSSHTDHITPSPWYSCSSFIINGWSMWASWGAWLSTLNKHSIKSSAYFAGHKLKRCSFHMTN